MNRLRGQRQGAKPRLHSMGLEHFPAGPGQPVTVLLQTLPHRVVVAQLPSAEARCVARAGLLLLRGAGVALSPSGGVRCKHKDKRDRKFAHVLDPNFSAQRDVVGTTTTLACSLPFLFPWRAAGSGWNDRCPMRGHANQRRTNLNSSES